jgi:hypothetical protein
MTPLLLTFGGRAVLGSRTFIFIVLDPLIPEHLPIVRPKSIGRDGPLFRWQQARQALGTICGVLLPRTGATELNAFENDARLEG